MDYMDYHEDVINGCVLPECCNKKESKKMFDTVSDANQNSLLLLPKCLHNIELKTILGCKISYEKSVTNSHCLI